MSDISKCEGKGCPIVGECKRVSVKANELYQSYIEPVYKDGECIFFIQNKLTVKIIKK